MPSRYGMARHLLIYNHNVNDPNSDKPKGVRSPLNLAVSSDGKHWEAALVIEDEPKNQFSYPAVIQTADGLVHITYTWKAACGSNMRSSIRAKAGDHTDRKRPVALSRQAIILPAEPASVVYGLLHKTIVRDGNHWCKSL